MSNAPAVIAIPQADLGRGVAVITSGFIADPFVRWMYADPHDYLKWFPEMVRLSAASACDDGTFYVAGNFGAAAIWNAPGVKPDDDELGKLIEDSIRPEIKDDLFAVFEELDTYHPHDEPCWYLPTIAADITQQGRGLGSALMKHALQRCDEEGIQAYLESSNPANMTLYERHGFQTMGRIQVNGSPPLHPMIRPVGG